MRVHQYFAIFYVCFIGFIAAGNVQGVEKRATKCTTSVVSPTPKGLNCGAQGSLKSPSLIKRFKVNALSNCVNKCLPNAACLSFSYQSSSGQCQTFNKPIKGMGFSKNTSSGVVFYSRDCFTVECPVKTVTQFTTTTITATQTSLKTTTETSTQVSTSVETAFTTDISSVVDTTTEIEYADGPTSTLTSRETTTLNEFTYTPSTYTITARFYTSTTISLTETVVVPTSAGFKPIKSTTATLKKRSQNQYIADEPGNPEKRAASSTTTVTVTRTEIVTLVETQMSTEVTVKTSVATETTTSVLTSTAKSTKTVTSTSTLTTDEATTLTITTTRTYTGESYVPVYESTTFISSTTTTSTTTTYEACATNNIFGPRYPNGDRIEGTTISPGTFTSRFPGQFTAYDCCVTCVQDPLCAFSQIYIYSGNSATCVNYINNAGTCPAQGQNALHGLYKHRVGTDTSDSYYSNGYCGYWSDKGS